MSSCIPPSIRRPKANPRVFSAIFPLEVGISGLVQKTRPELPVRPPPFSSFHGTPSANTVQTQINRVSRKNNPFWETSGICPSGSLTMTV
jgi:hypothetical protein